MQTASPEPAPPDSELAFCGEFDAGLDRVAKRLVDRSAHGLPDLETEELAFALRAEGVPHVWPEAWTFASAAEGQIETTERATRWLSTLRSAGQRRCGVGRAAGKDGSRMVTLLVVGALAELAPLPTKARLGQWIRFDATLLVDAENAHLVVLPPDGPPRSLLLTTLHERAVEAVFSVDRRGPWLTQLVGTVAGGPRPLLEAAIFVDDDAPLAPSERTAPGEGAADGAHSDAEALESMVNAVRRDENLQRLSSSPDLQRAAERHARAMRDAHVLAHDVGDGSPVDRLRMAGVEATFPGENVAHARTVARAHRILWASPSHRENLLDPRFSKFGAGVVRDEDGSVWVCELFTNSNGAGIGPRVQAY